MTNGVDAVDFAAVIAGNIRVLVNGLDALLGRFVAIVRGQFVGNHRDLGLHRLGVAAGDETLFVLLPLQALFRRDGDRIVGILRGKRQTLRHCRTGGKQCQDETGGDEVAHHRAGAGCAGVSDFARGTRTRRAGPVKITTPSF